MLLYFIPILLDLDMDIDLVCQENVDPIFTNGPHRGGQVGGVAGGSATLGRHQIGALDGACKKGRQGGALTYL